MPGIWTEKRGNKRTMRCRGSLRASSVARRFAALAFFVVLVTVAWRWVRGRVICRGQPARVVLAVACVGPKSPISAALDRFKADMGRYPTSAEGLEVLAAVRHKDERFRGPYITRQALHDPWGSPFAYRCPGSFDPSAYDLWSYGRNAQDDGGRGAGDDIAN